MMCSICIIATGIYITQVRIVKVLIYVDMALRMYFQVQCTSRKNIQWSCTFVCSYKVFKIGKLKCVEQNQVRAQPQVLYPYRKLNYS